MNKRTRNIVIAATLLAVTGGAYAFGGGGPGFGPGSCNKGGGPMQAVSQLDLTSEQRDQLRDLRRAQRDKMEVQRDAMRDNRRALRDAVEDGADETTIKQLAKQRGELVTAMTLQRTEMRSKVNAILTEEQRAQVGDIGFGPRYGGHKRGHHGW